MEAKLFNKTDTGLLTVLSSVSVGSSFKQLTTEVSLKSCSYGGTTVTHSNSPHIFIKSIPPISEHGAYSTGPLLPPLYAIWCSSARVVVDLICWIWSKRNVVLQSVSKCPTDLYNKLLLSFPIWYNIRTDFVRLPLYCCQVALCWCCQTDGANPIHDWSFLDWRLKEMISWSKVYGLYLLLSLSPARYGPETSSDIDSIKNISHKKWKIFEVLSERVLLQLQQCHWCSGWWML